MIPSFASLQFHPLGKFVGTPLSPTPRGRNIGDPEERRRRPTTDVTGRGGSMTTSWAADQKPVNMHKYRSSFRETVLDTGEGTTPSESIKLRSEILSECRDNDFSQRF